MKLGAFLKALEHDAEKVWSLIGGSPEVQKVEAVAVEAVAAALEAAVHHYVPGPIGDELDALVQALAAKVVGAIPAETNVPDKVI